MTALDQQVSVLEAKLNKSLAEGERSRHNSSTGGARADINRDEVLKIVRDSLPDNQERG